MRKFVGYSIIISSSLLASGAWASCGAAMCMLNTNWDLQGVWTQAGARLDLRYEYINQDEVLDGSDKASEDALEHEHHREVKTINRNLQANLDYAFNETYGVSVNLPLISRDHLHLHHSHATGEMEREEWDFSEAGDVRLLGRMQISPTTDVQRAYGINLGIKLPTGKYDVANDDGEQAERSMQPGTGTTDAIVGGYYRRHLPEIHSQWFTQILFNKALNEREGFKPGQQWSWDLGYRYQPATPWSLLAQLNYAVKSRDSGDEAEPEDSGARTLSLSPGVSVALGKATQVYGFVHHRLYQDVNGLQLSAKDSFVVGLSTRF